MRWTLLMLGLLLLQACIPSFGLLDKDEKRELRQKRRCERKYNRYVAKCPENVQLDSVLVPIHSQADSQTVVETFHVVTDTTVLDSLLERIAAIASGVSVDSNVPSDDLLRRIRSGIIREYAEKLCITDTLSVDTTFALMIDDDVIYFRVRTDVYQPDPNTVRVKVTAPQQNFTTTTTIIDEKIVKPEYTWQEKLYNNWRTVAWILVVLLVLYVAYRVVKKFFKPI